MVGGPMRVARRQFLAGSLGGFMAGAAPANRAGGTIRCVLFDALVLFDIRAIESTAERIAPGQGSQLKQLWLNRLFDYQWLHALADRYVDFLQAAADSLNVAANQMNITLGPSLRDRLLGHLERPAVWPDVRQELDALLSSGVCLGILSNMTESMLEAGLNGAGLGTKFKYILSTDQVRNYKPARAAYQLGVDATRLTREEILFAAFAGWDAAGATWFGFPTFWVNRANSVQEEFGVRPLYSGPDLAALRLLLTASRGAVPSSLEFRKGFPGPARA